MFLSFQMIFSLASAAIVWAALQSTSLLEPSSHIMAPRYLKWFTVFNFCPCIVMSLCKVPLFVIILVFSALISMPNFSAAVSKLCTSSVSSSSSPVIPSMSSAKRRFVILRPPMLMVPLKFSRACVMISSRNMLKRVGESRHPWRTPTYVRGLYPIGRGDVGWRTRTISYRPRWRRLLLYFWFRSKVELLLLVLCLCPVHDIWLVACELILLYDPVGVEVANHSNSGL